MTAKPSYEELEEKVARLEREITENRPVLRQADPDTSKIRCWEMFRCGEAECPVLKNKELRCWLVSGTHCRKEIQGKFLEKLEMCLECEVLKANLDLASMEDTLRVADKQFKEFRGMVDERDRELEGIGMELAIALSEVFEALKEISSGNPLIRIPETSEMELVSKLKHLVNLTAENLLEIVDLSHEFAIGLAEHFDVLHRVSKGDLGARVQGVSDLELLESLKKVTNQMIESVSRTIREREQADEALRESEEKYRFLFDYDPNSIFVLEADTFRIMDVNSMALDTYGYQKEGLIGKSFLDLGSEGYADGVLSEGNLTSSATWSSVYSNVRHHRVDGTPFYVNVYASWRRRSKKYGIIATTVDITEMLEKESQLIQACKMATLGEMATGVAHELNQPLSVIKTASSFLKRKAEKRAPIQEEILLTMTEEMDGHVDRASKIISHLREFGRKSRVEKEEVVVNRVMERAMDMFSQQLKLRQIEVVRLLDEQIPSILADANRLEQVFINLLVNARDSLEEKGGAGECVKRITLQSYVQDDTVVVKVADTGTGIQAPILDKIFEPFFTTKTQTKGTGLGLSISYGIVQDYNGTIDVETEEGQGTTFTVQFPAYHRERSVL